MVLKNCEKFIFSLDKARELLPLVQFITQKTNEKVAQIEKKRDLSLSGYQCDECIQQEVNLWYQKMERLGLYPKGIWIVDFDNGQGYFCWKYPEPEILHVHGYDDGFSHRRKIYENSSVSDQPDTWKNFRKHEKNY